MSAGEATMAPETTTTGAAMLARSAAFCTAEGRLCRPFCFLLGRAPSLTNLPYFESAPSYSAMCAFSLGLMFCSPSSMAGRSTQHRTNCHK